MTEDRCGYTHNVSRFPDIGGVCCWRPVWDDHDHCVWHTDVTDKSLEELTALAPSSGERFDGAILQGSVMTELDGLVESTFIDADFTRADVSEIDFTGADLREATFRDANARQTTFTSANLEDTLLRGVDLRGADLVQAQLDEVEFSESRINRATTFGDQSVYETNLAQATNPKIRRELFESATWTYRTLQQLAHQNSRRNQTIEYYQREQDLRRRFAWNEGHYLFALKAEASRWLTGYGHNPWRILGVSLGIIVLCAVIYPLTGGVQEPQVEQAITYTLDEPTESSRGWIAIVFFKSLYFSATTFVTLGYGDFQPIGRWAQTLAGVEALLGNFLMALLVVVIARRITWIG